MGIGVMDWWRRRSAWRRARAEAKHLTKEARRILRRKSFRIPQSVADTVTAAVSEVDEALRTQDLERMRAAIGALDEVMDDKLAFARKSTLREYSESIGIAVAIALLLRAFVVEAFQIPSGSMIPTLQVGDHIFVSKFSYGLGIPFTNKKILELNQPSRGDVIVFKYPLDPNTDYIKRVVGLPGDTIEVRQNEVFLNGHPVPREHIGSYKYSDSGTPEVDDREVELWSETLGAVRHEELQEDRPYIRNFPPFTVPQGNVFVMGDNRDNSSDSRVWGPVSHELIKGKALVVWWSRAPAAQEAPWYQRPVEWLRSIRWRRFFHPVR